LKYNLKQCIKGGANDKRPGYLIAFDYDPEAVEAIKEIPHTCREWRPDEKVWWISEEYEATLDTLFGNFHALAHLQGQLF